MSAEVAIVGGGVVGLATAWTLAKSGMDVALFDAAAFGGGASESAQGGIGVAPWMTGFDLAWQRRAVDVFERTLGDEAGLIAMPRGMLFLADEDAARALRRQVDELSAAGVASEWLDAPALRSAEPALAHHLAGAAWLPHGFHVDVRRLLVLLGRRAAEAGARLFAHEQVDRIRLRGREVRGVETEHRTVQAASVIVAAGTETQSLLRGIAATQAILPQRGCVLRVEMPAPALHHYVIEANYAASLDVRYGSGRSIAAVLQPMGDGTLRVGSSRDFVGSAPAPGDTIREAMLVRAGHFVPALSTYRVSSAAVGFRPWTADNRPLIGPVKGIGGLYVAAGHNGDGIATAFATADSIAVVVTDAAAEPISEFCPTRTVATPSPCHSSAECP